MINEAVKRDTRKQKADKNSNHSTGLIYCKNDSEVMFRLIISCYSQTELLCTLGWLLHTTDGNLPVTL